MENHLPKAIICDLDGTLALLNGRNPYDATTAEEDLLNSPIANILEVYSHQKLHDVRVIIITGRQEIHRPQTERWLKKHNITNYEGLFMRQNGDMRKDIVIKKELYKTYVKGKYEILFVLEDRDQVVKMWRTELGLTCLQVDYGAF
jgi:hypothetical protein